MGLTHIALCWLFACTYDIYIYINNPHGFKSNTREEHKKVATQIKPEPWCGEESARVYEVLTTTELCNGVLPRRPPTNACSTSVPLRTLRYANIGALRPWTYTCIYIYIHVWIYIYIYTYLLLAYIIISIWSLTSRPSVAALPSRPSVTAFRSRAKPPKGLSRLGAVTEGRGGRARLRTRPWRMGRDGRPWREGSYTYNNICQ